MCNLVPLFNLYCIFSGAVAELAEKNKALESLKGEMGGLRRSLDDVTGLEESLRQANATLREKAMSISQLEDTVQQQRQKNTVQINSGTGQDSTKAGGYMVTWCIYQMYMHVCNQARSKFNMTRQNKAVYWLNNSAQSCRSQIVQLIAL